GRTGREQTCAPQAFSQLVTAREPDGGSVHVPRHVRARRRMRELLRRPSLPDLDGGATAIETRLRDRLLTPVPGSGLWGWIGALLATAVAGALRLVRLCRPDQ